VLHLANDQLRIECLDPKTDAHLLGPRFCWGGFIWQVQDASVGPLLAGPEWPKSDPRSVNGQGLPESFRHRTRSGEPHTWSGSRGVALGVGELALGTAGEVKIVQPCEWTITQSAAQISFHTRQEVAEFHYELVRTVELTGRSLRSRSHLINHATEPLKLEWFAHPFFALSDGLIKAELPEGTILPENPGFVVDGRQFSQKRPFKDQFDGHLDFLQLPPATPLAVRLSHPRLTHVDFATSFVPSECIVWGNSNTFSVEPYRTLALEPGAAQEWDLRYDFGYAV